MSLRMFTVTEKRQVIDEITAAERRQAQACGQPLRMARRYQVLAAIAADLRARESLDRHGVLDQIERDLRAAVEVKDVNGFSPGALEALANTFISKWPILSQALESLGKETTR